MKEGRSLYIYIISFTASIGGFLFGYDTAIISGCNSFLTDHFQLTPALLGWVVSSALFGTILGCIVSGMITDRIGRKYSLIVAALLLIVSAVGCMLVPQFLGESSHGWINSSLQAAYNWLVLFRLIGGIGVGITSVVAPIYISELTSSESRGKMVSIYQLSITLGILFAFLVDWVVLTHAGEEAGIISNEKVGFLKWIFVEELWRGMLGSEIPIALLFFGLLFFTPQSPRWLITKGRFDKAKKILIRLGGEERAEVEMNEILSLNYSNSGSVKELFSPSLRIPLLIGILLPMFSHLSGIAAIMYFAPNILNESLQNVDSSFLGAVLVGMVNSVFTFVAITKIEKFGRRNLLLIGVSGAFLSLTAVGLLFALGSSYVIIPLLFYVASFAFSFGPIVWVIISEIFPTHIRGFAVSVGSFSLMVTGFFITLTNPVFFEIIKPSGTFFLYAVLTLPAIWFIWKFVPETKGRTLEQIQRYWKNRRWD